MIVALAALGALGLVVIVFTLGVLQGGDVETIFLVAVSLAVAAVPEAAGEPL